LFISKLGKWACRTE